MRAGNIPKSAGQLPKGEKSHIHKQRAVVYSKKGVKRPTLAQAQDASQFSVTTKANTVASSSFNNYLKNTFAVNSLYNKKMSPNHSFSPFKFSNPQGKKTDIPPASTLKVDNKSPSYEDLKKSNTEAQLIIGIRIEDDFPEGPSQKIKTDLPSLTKTDSASSLEENLLPEIKEEILATPEKNLSPVTEDTFPKEPNEKIETDLPSLTKTDSASPLEENLPPEIKEEILAAPEKNLSPITEDTFPKEPNEKIETDLPSLTKFDSASPLEENLPPEIKEEILAAPEKNLSPITEDTFPKEPNEKIETDLPSLTKSDSASPLEKNLPPEIKEEILAAPEENLSPVIEDTLPEGSSQKIETELPSLTTTDSASPLEENLPPEIKEEILAAPEKNLSPVIGDTPPEDPSQKIETELPSPTKTDSASPLEENLPPEIKEEILAAPEKNLSPAIEENNSIVVENPQEQIEQNLVEIGQFILSNEIEDVSQRAKVVAEKICQPFPSLQSQEVVASVADCLQRLKDNSLKEIKSNDSKAILIKESNLYEFIGMLIGLFILTEILEGSVSPDNAEIHDLNEVINEFVEEIVKEYEAATSGIEKQKLNLANAYDELRIDLINRKSNIKEFEHLINDLDDIKNRDLALLDTYINSLNNMKKNAEEYETSTHPSNEADINRRFGIHALMFTLSLNPALAVLTSVALDMATNPQLTKSEAKQTYLNFLEKFSTVPGHEIKSMTEMHKGIGESKENLETKNEEKEIDLIESIQHRFEQFPVALSKGIVGAGVEDISNRLISRLLGYKHLQKFTPLLNTLSSNATNLNPFIQKDELKNLSEDEDIAFYMKKTREQTKKDVANVKQYANEEMNQFAENLKLFREEAFSTTKTSEIAPEQSEIAEQKNTGLIMKTYNTGLSFFKKMLS